MELRGEWAGALVVVATLFYLARQIRLGNRVSRFDTMNGLLEKFDSSNDRIVADAFLRHALMKTEPLSADEEEQVYTFVNMFCNTWTVAQTAFEEGLIEEDYYIGLKVDVSYEIERWHNFGRFVKRWMDTYPVGHYDIFSEVERAIEAKGVKT